MIYSLRHPKRAFKKGLDLFKEWGAAKRSLLEGLDKHRAEILNTILDNQRAYLQAGMKTKVITVTKPDGPTARVLSNSTEGIHPSHYNFETDQCGYPIKRDLNPKLEPVYKQVMLDPNGKIESDFLTRETIATVARRSALNVGVPPRKLK